MRRAAPTRTEDILASEFPFVTLRKPNLCVGTLAVKSHLWAIVRNCSNIRQRSARLDLAYSNTSSASPNSFGGMVISSAFAVLRLIDNIILVGNSTGSSPGGVPRRILSTK